MRSSNKIHVKAGYKWIITLIFAFAISLLNATEARAERCVADLGGVVDGFVTPNPPSQIQIDGNCTIRNFTASNPLRTNFSFYTSPGQNNQRWLVIFDNVVHTGNMSCNNVQGHRIWFTNGSSSKIKEGCQNLLIPVEKIVKQNPAGQTTASIGVPFTYKLTIPVLFDPATGTVSNANGSPNDLHGITVSDDLNATGVDLSYVSHRAYWLSNGAPISPTFSNVGGVLTFDNFPVVPALRQFVIEITVVLGDTPANVPGKQFVNTAKWDFGRLIEGVFYEPLPGEWGISPPMTIAAPVLTVTKSGPAALNLGQWGNFGIDVRNTGLSDAWSASIRDVLPDGTAGGMCDLTPEILSARVYAADGVTPVPGKGPLNQGSDYSLSYSAAPNCRLDITMLTAAGRIGPNERLIIRYRTQLDNDTQNGVTLTNVAGAIQWFNGDSSVATRKSFARTLTNGTPGVVDHEDAFAVNAALSGYFFEKTVADITSGANPATTAAPGDKLRYTLRFRTTSQALSNFRILDELDALNAQAAFEPGTLMLIASPSGADVSATSSTGGVKGTGAIDIRNLSVPVNSQALIQFDITLKAAIANNTVVANQATLRLANGTTFATSDDPNVNGAADPNVSGDEDPTRITIVSVPPPPPVFRIQKISTDRTGDPNVLLAGETLRYTITAKNMGTTNAVNVVLRDAVPANATYVAGTTTLNGAPVSDVAGVSPLVSSMRINPPGNTTPGSMPADASTNPANVATITFDVVVNANAAGGTVISNQGFVSGTGFTDLPSDDPDTPAPNDPTLDTVTSLAPPALAVTKSGPATLNLGQWGNFSIDIRNTGLSEGWNASIRDVFPDGATGGMCDLMPEILSAQVYAADGTTAVPGKGPLNQGSDYSLSYSAAPNCRLDITMLTAAGRIGPSERLIIRYRTQLDTNTQNGVSLTNVAGTLQWFNGDSSNSNRQSFTRTLSNGTPGVVDHEDAFTVTVPPSGYFFEKTVADLTSGANPATSAAPGDKLRYTLRFRTTSQALNNFRILDEPDALNAQADFAPGTLTLVTSPAGADVSATSSTGGARGTGLIDIRNLNAPANGEVLIQFDITLKPALANSTVVANQATLRLANDTLFATSDDPNVNGPANPAVSGDEDPTRVTIVSASGFRVQKISTDRTGDPNLLLAGETLRYTITAKNIGTTDAVSVVLRDAVPANTTYVAGSTTLNGAAVPDVAAVSPLVNGMPINPPGATTPGSMPADASSNPANVATITFDVVVNANTATGTLISNQGFVSGTGFTNVPSDDPDTSAPNDPTRDIVGNTGYFFEKTVADITSGANPAITAAPGNKLRYSLRFRTTGQSLNNFRILDEPDALNAQAAFAPGTLALVTSPAGADISATSSTAGARGTGVIDIRNLNVPANGEVLIQFDITLKTTLTNNTIVGNQATLRLANDTLFATSDDPNVNGPANPAVSGDEDPTRVTIVSASGFRVQKISTDRTGDPNVLLAGETLRYTITAKNIGTADAVNVVLRDAVPANTTYVAGSTTLNGAAVPDVAAVSPLVNGMPINPPGATTPGSMPADASTNPANVATITFDVIVNATTASGTVISNQGFVNGTGFTAVPSDDPDTAAPNDPTRDVVAGNISAPVLVVTKTGPATMNPGQWGNFAIDVRNTGPGDAWNVNLRDQLPDGATGGMCDLTPEILSAQVFAADGATLVSGKGALSSGSGYSVSYSAAPNCQLGITLLTAAGTIGPNERLIIRYRTQLDAGTRNGITLTNVAGATQWFNGDSSNSARVTYNRALTNGTVGTPDHEDATTVTVAAPTSYIFEKTAENLTRGVYPATTAAPGDMLRYTLRVRATDPTLANFRIFDDLGTLNPAPAFVPGTLTLVTYPTGADISSTNSTAGTRGMGVIDIRNLNLPITGDLVIQFDVKLASNLTSGTVIANQSTLRLANGTVFALSDDPNVNGAANPLVSGDEDPTRVTIVSTAPKFLVQKISTDLTGDPEVLLAGETLRYTITVKNAGNADAVNVVLRDLVPANTIYAAGSTRLNGVAVPDSAGLSQLVDGMPINSPNTPGSMRADASSNDTNVATITFDVVVNRNVVDGVVISNQGFVSAAAHGILDIPSDDPDTPAPNDPTRDIVGSRPLLYAEKRVALFADLGSPGIVDPGDVLRYTITVQNNSLTIPSTAVILRDTVPANTTYVANSTLHNGQPAGQPDGGISPLASGINISSGFGLISPGARAVVQFDLRVNAGTPAGTMISNQAVVTSYELPNLLTDGDGNPATGPEPTVVVVGARQQLSIAKQVVVVGGGAAIPGAQLEYVVSVTNIGAVPALNTVITDDLNTPQPGMLAYVNGSATLNGAAAGVTFTGSTITANYGAVSGPLEPGGVVVLRFRATLAAGLMINTVVTNTGVVTWNQPPQTASASVSLFVGGVPGFSVLNGSAWHDADFDDTRDSGERPLDGWTVDLYRDGLLFHSLSTDAAGAYRIIGVEPNNISGVAYELRFRGPGAGANTAMLGMATSAFTNGMQRITNIVVWPATNLVDLNLPIHPNGVIYNSVARSPIGGAALTMRNFDIASPLPAGCFADPAQQGQITLANGYYKFDINFSDPACPSGGTYVISVTAGTDYRPGDSQNIPPASDSLTGVFSVPACPAGINDAIPGTTLFCEVQSSEFPPDASVAARSAGTLYYAHMRLDGSRMPGTSQIFNNHIPLDPLAGPVVISKTTPLVNVTRGQQVPYVITVNNPAAVLLTGVSIVDRIPAGFTYVAGSALLDGVAAEPSVSGLELRWNGLAIAGNESRTVKLLLTVGAGVNEGEYVNRAQALSLAIAGTMSREATATVRVVPDPTFDCTDVTGKVFNDANRNGLQDGGEEGLAGVRVVTVRGLAAATDQFGRYHITCAVTPNENRGSNFVLKLDDRTLPSGFRMSTDKMKIQRATRGKNLQINFGASIHRVISIDLLDEAFEPGTTEIRVQWKPRLDVLLKELRKTPAVLRLSYVADTEDEALVNRRVDAIKRQLTEAWDTADDSYVLTIEREVFWRRGAPVKRPGVRVPNR